jgi:hypothetical protein
MPLTELENLFLFWFYKDFTPAALSGTSPIPENIAGRNVRDGHGMDVAMRFPAQIGFVGDLRLFVPIRRKYALTPGALERDGGIRARNGCPNISGCRERFRPQRATERGKHEIANGARATYSNV